MPKIRLGKTRREHQSGVHQNRFNNRAARVAWQNTTDKNPVFPHSACNGKRNRYRITGKEGKTIILK